VDVTTNATEFLFAKVLRFSCIAFTGLPAISLFGGSAAIRNLIEAIAGVPRLVLTFPHSATAAIGPMNRRPYRRVESAGVFEFD
jgi:hypothetical protein